MKWTERSKKRLTQLLCGEGLPNAYGLGSARTMDDFIAFSGIDYRQKILTEPNGGLI